MKTFLRVTAALLLPVASLTVLAAAAPSAAAAVQPCSVTYSAPAGFSIGPKPADGSQQFSFQATKLTVDDSRTVLDLDIAYTINHPAGQDLSLHVLGPMTDSKTLTPTSQTINPGQVSGRLLGTYSYDDEAMGKISGSNPPPARYQPATPATSLEGTLGRGPWSLWVNNYGSSTGALTSFSVTLTYATCDTDGDGHEEKADNCPSVANVDQANLDGDSLGDLCDRDADGDGVANDIDECPRVLSTLNTGCPSASRSLALTQRRSKLKLAITSSAPACITTKRVVVYRKRRGKDPKVFTVTTNSVGKARHTAPRKPGRYYAQVTTQHVPGVVDCAADTSRIIKISRR